MKHRKDFIDRFECLCVRHQSWRVFSDFVVIAACSLSSTVDRGTSDGDDRGKEYLDVVRRYESKETLAMGEMLGCVIVAAATSPFDDFLGSIFHELGLASHWHGQFFTPSHLAKLTASMTMHDAKTLVERQGFVTVNEPACGAGAMVLGACAALHEQGLDHTSQMHVVATDLDRTAALMCYVQLCAHGVPAVVRVGDTLEGSARENWLTPAHCLDRWSEKLQNAYNGS